MSADERKDEGAEDEIVAAVAVTRDPEGDDPAVWRIAGTDTRRRVGLVERLWASDPDEKGIASTDALAARFGVTPRSIQRDKVAIRAANAQKCENKTEEVAEVLAELDECSKGSQQDVNAAAPGHQNRAAHRNVILKANQQKVDILFKLGYWTQVAHKYQFSGDGLAHLSLEELLEIARNGNGNGNGNRDGADDPAGQASPFGTGAAGEVERR